MVDMTGQIIGHYRVETLLDSSGDDLVYQAVDVYEHAPVAIKFLNARYADSPTRAARVLQHFRAVSELLHPNIIDVLDYGEHNGRLYVVMEWVPDRSLRALQERLGPHESLPLYVGIDLMRQAAEGLSYAHRRGLLHRNIKPENMLLRRVPDALGTSSEYQLKLTDFGLVSPVGSRGRHFTMHTPALPAYMPPEHHQGGELDGRSDVYSLGVVMFEAATGFLPFEARTPGEAAFKHALTPAPSPREARPDIPEELSSIIMRCLEKNPAARFQTARELADALSVLMPDMQQPAPAASPVDFDPQPDLPDQAGVLMRIDRDQLQITPGNPVSLTVTLENRSAFPLRVMLTADGVSPDWVRLPPGVVDLPPRSKMSGPIHFLVDRKPASTAGDHLLIVRAHIPGRTEPAAEGRVRISVLPFSAVRVHLDPPVTSGRRRGNYRVTIENLGNERRLVEPAADNEPGDMRFQFEPARIMLEAGHRVTSSMTVQSAIRWVGSGREARDFAVLATSSGGGGDDRTPPVAGTFVQLPQFPVWALPVCVLVLLLAGLALTMLPDDDDDADIAGVSVTSTVADGVTEATGATDVTPATEGDPANATEQETPVSTDSQISIPPAGGTPAAGATAVPTEPPPTEQAAVNTPQLPAARSVPLIAFTTARGTGPNGILDVYVIEPDGSNERPLITDPGDDWAPAWSNDGTRIAWTSKRHGRDEIYVANADGSDPLRLTDDPEDDRFPAWSPDDSLIAFTRGEGAGTELYVVSADGGQPLRLTGNTAFDGNPSWSPDGEQIAFVSNRTGSNEIYIMNADGTAVEQITDSDGNNFNPLWSPDGERLLFITDRDGDRDIYSIEMDGAGEDPLALEPADEYAPAWSPDGDRIAFARESDAGTVDLYVMEADGSDQEMVAEDLHADDPNLVWSPDGSLIAFLRSGDPGVDMYVVSLADGEITRLTTNPTFDGNMTWSLVSLED